MSTRSCIARRTGETAFAGVYHHWDGYPSGVGATLFALYNGHFGKDLPLMLKTLIDDHPGGWSTINGADFSKAPGYNERRIGEDREDDRPQCFCHGDRHEEGWVCTNENASGSGCEYAYVFTDGARMLVLSSYCEDGEKMVGMFGMGDEGATWRLIADVDLNGPEPKWEGME